MKKIFIVLLLSIYSAGNYAQILNIEKQMTLGGSLYDYAIKVIRLNNGNYLLLSQSDSQISGNKTASNYGLSDYWLVALDSNLNILWQKSFGGSGYDIPTDIVLNGSRLYI